MLSTLRPPYGHATPLFLSLLRRAGAVARLMMCSLLVLMLACIMVGANLLVDLLYAVLDPRVRVQR